MHAADKSLDPQKLFLDIESQPRTNSGTDDRNTDLSNNKYNGDLNSKLVWYMNDPKLFAP